MRVRFLTVAALMGAYAVSGTFSGLAAADDKYKQVSRTLVSQAIAAQKADKAEDAQTLFERALVADPASLQALIGLGQTHEAQGRVGRGLKYYRQALAIDPNEHVALEAQAVAFLKRDMVERAEANRDKLARLCTSGCKALDAVALALDTYKAEKAEADADKPSNGE